MHSNIKFLTKKKQNFTSNTSLISKCVSVQTHRIPNSMRHTMLIGLFIWMIRCDAFKPLPPFPSNTHAHKQTHCALIKWTNSKMQCILKCEQPADILNFIGIDHCPFPRSENSKTHIESSSERKRKKETNRIR